MKSKKSDQKENRTKEPLVEYNETIESSTDKEIKETESKRRWRNVESIEKKVDILHITRAEKPESEVDRTVDRLIKKNKRK